MRLSLAATGGILLGAGFHHGLTRPGIGLYGGLPFAAARPVVTLSLPVIQVRDVAPGETVGYGAAWTAARPSRIAILAAGYADGLLRALGGGSVALYAGRQAVPAGRPRLDGPHHRRRHRPRGGAGLTSKSSTTARPSTTSAGPPAPSATRS